MKPASSHEERTKDGARSRGPGSNLIPGIAMRGTIVLRFPCWTGRTGHLFSATSRAQAMHSDACGKASSLFSEICPAHRVHVP